MRYISLCLQLGSKVPRFVYRLFFVYVNIDHWYSFLVMVFLVLSGWGLVDVICIILNVPAKFELLFYLSFMRIINLPTLFSYEINLSKLISYKIN